MDWSKQKDAFVAQAGDPVIFTARVRPRGDGRWVWEIFQGATTTVIATGILASLGAARTAANNFVSRSGRV
jgi:hypothetical protein